MRNNAKQLVSSPLLLPSYRFSVESLWRGVDVRKGCATMHARACCKGCTCKVLSALNVHPVSLKAFEFCSCQADTLSSGIEHASQAIDMPCSKFQASDTVVHVCTMPRFRSANPTDHTIFTQTSLSTDKGLSSMAALMSAMVAHRFRRHNITMCSSAT